MLVVIRIRGGVKIRKETKDTLRMLRLNRKMHAVIIKNSPSYKGMLQAAKDWITWGEVGELLVEQLLAKRGRKEGDKRLSQDEVKAALKMLKEDKSPMEAGVKPVLRLSPPSGGFKHSIKQHWPRGELGYRGKEMEALIRSMM